MTDCFVMQLAGLPSGEFTPFDGDYLADFDFEADDGRGRIKLAGFDISKAKRFPDMEAAMAFYRTQPQCRPTRPDGKPNRPLTATNWTFVSITANQLENNDETE